VTKIVTWNTDHWRRRADERRAAWEFLRGLQPDYALLQEAVPPRDLAADHLAYREGGIEGKAGEWGSLVVSFAGPLRVVGEARSPYAKRARATSIHRTFAGALAVAEAGVLILISAYGALDEGYAVTTVHRLLSDLTPLLDSSPKSRVVLAGDLNLSTQLAEPHRARHRNALERFATLGLVDCLSLQLPPRPRLARCPCKDNPCQHVRTERHPGSRVPWQTDYMFVSQSLVPRVRACFALDAGRPDPWQLSDHCPVVLELAD